MKKQKMRLISAVLAACMMTSVLPVNALALGGTPENGVNAQENEEAESAPTELVPETDITITKGGNYEIPEGKYAGNITVNLTDTSEPVNIAIKGGITYNGKQQVMFILVKNADEVTITNDGHEVNCAPSDAHFLDVNSGNVTVNGGTYVTATRNLVMAYAGTTTLNDMTTETSGYAVTSSGSAKVVVNRGTHTHSNTNQDRANFWIYSGGHMTLNDVNAISDEAVIINSNGTVNVNGGDFKTTGTKSCFVNNSANLTINKGTFASEGASCIQNSWGRVEINGGTITSDADCTIKNRGSLRMNGGTVATSNAEGTVIDCTGNFGDTWINGGTIKGGKDGIRLVDLGSSGVTLKSEVTLTQATFENNTNDIHLGEGQQINIKKTFTGKAKILVDDAKAGRRITQENDDARYQKDLDLVSNNEGYTIGYKRGEDGKEYRYLADAKGNAVSTQDAKATADLGAGAQQLDTTDVVPEGKDVTVTANIPEGAEFLGWSAVRDDGKALDLGDDQTAHFKMPGCNVTVTALYQGGNGGPVNPGGGSSDVVTGIAAVALTGAAAWGIYEAGTGIYRVLNMPGVPMPSNRAGLATLIWEKAGCPEPQTVKSFSDIDDADLHLRKAVSWMEEQGLMDDVKENEFRPYRYVTKLQTCLVWDKAKEESLIS